VVNQWNQHVELSSIDRFDLRGCIKVTNHMFAFASPIISSRRILYLPNISLEARECMFFLTQEAAILFVGAVGFSSIFGDFNNVLYLVLPWQCNSLHTRLMHGFIFHVSSGKFLDYFHITIKDN